MYLSFGAAAIGQRVELKRAIELAAQNHFTGVDVSIDEVAALVDEHGSTAVRALFEGAGVRPGAWGLPVDWRNDEAAWQKGLEALPRQAEVARQLGMLRTSTYIMPGHNDRTFDENFDFHTQRLRACAEILAAQEIALALEFVGPKTLRDQFTHPFIYTIAGALSLADALKTGNTGLLVDAFHVYTSGGTNAEVAQLRADQVVYVHVNDAIGDTPRDQQLDNVRTLPGATGVIDLTGFLHALRDIGYDGPVTAEPFNARLRELPVEEAAAETGEAMHRMWRAAGL